MFNLNSREVHFALEAVRLASQLVRQVQSDLVSPALTKDDRSPVTVADFASQALVGHLLAETFPGDPLVAEEDSQTLRATSAGRSLSTAPTLELVVHFVNDYAPQADPQTVCDWIDHARADTAPRFWTLDPIDGTKGFLRGNQYVVALALVIDGQVQLGVLGCPNLTEAHFTEVGGPGSLVVAVRGQGAWTTPLAAQGGFERLQVSRQADPSQARLLRSFESGHTNVSQTDVFARALDIQAEPVLMDSQAKYAVLAAGYGDLLLRLLSTDKPHYREKIWDQAAGSLVLQEAGGQITDLDGNALDFTVGRDLIHNRGILASNRLLHPTALQALRTIGA